MLYWHPAMGTIIVDQLTYDIPDLIIVSGTDPQGQECNVLAHVSAVQLVIRPVAPALDAPPPRPIGFTVNPKPQDAE